MQGATRRYSQVLLPCSVDDHHLGVALGGLHRRLVATSSGPHCHIRSRAPRRHLRSDDAPPFHLSSCRLPSIRPRHHCPRWYQLLDVSSRSSRPRFGTVREGLADILEAAGIVEDDKWIVSWDGSRLEVDHKRPRVEVELSTVD